MFQLHASHTHIHMEVRAHMHHSSGTGGKRAMNCMWRRPTAGWKIRAGETNTDCLLFGQDVSRANTIQSFYGFFFCRCLSALSAQLITTTPPLSRARYKLLFIYDVPRRHWRWVHTHTTYRARSVVPPSSTTMNIFCLFLIRPIK